jgi:hypothetical protein
MLTPPAHFDNSYLVSCLEPVTGKSVSRVVFASLVDPMPAIDACSFVSLAFGVHRALRIRRFIGTILFRVRHDIISLRVKKK